MVIGDVLMAGLCAKLCTYVSGRRSIPLGGRVPGVRRRAPVAYQYQTGQGKVQGPREPDTERL